MKKLHYEENVPVAKLISDLYKEGASNKEEALREALMYVLHKGGFTESGVPVIQFEAAFEAFNLIMVKIMAADKKLVK